MLALILDTVDIYISLFFFIVVCVLYNLIVYCNPVRLSRGRIKALLTYINGNNSDDNISDDNISNGNNINGNNSDGNNICSNKSDGNKTKVMATSAGTDSWS